MPAPRIPILEQVEEAQDISQEDFVVFRNRVFQHNLAEGFWMRFMTTTLRSEYEISLQGRFLKNWMSRYMPGGESQRKSLFSHKVSHTVVLNRERQTAHPSTWVYSPLYPARLTAILVRGNSSSLQSDLYCLYKFRKMKWSGWKDISTNLRASCSLPSIKRAKSPTTKQHISKK
jgi:hypothetical protein